MYGLKPVPFKTDLNRQKRRLASGVRGIKLAAMQILRSAPVRLLLSMLAVFWFSQPLIFAAAPAKVHVVALGAGRKVPLDAAGERACCGRRHGQAGRDAHHEGPAAGGGRTAEGMDHRRSPRRYRSQLHHPPRLEAERRAAGRRDRALELAARPMAAGGPQYRPHYRAASADFDDMVSEAVWFRDYAAYCGTGTTAKEDCSRWSPSWARAAPWCSSRWQMAAGRAGRTGVQAGAMAA